MLRTLKCRGLGRDDEIARQQLHAQIRAGGGSWAVHFEFAPAHAHPHQSARGVDTEHGAVDDGADLIGADDGAQVRVQTHFADFTLGDDLAGLHEHDVGREPQDFVEIMGDVDHGNGQLVAQRLQVRQHFLAPRRSSDASGSSSSSSRGWDSSARPMATRCLSPPDSWWVRRVMSEPRSSRPVTVSRST